MESDIPADDALADRRATIQSVLADQPTANSSPSIYTTAQQWLEQTNHLLGVTLLTAAEACTSDATEYDQWTSAALAVEYLAAFARTHGNIITVETSDVRDSDTDDNCQISNQILAGDLLHTRAVELLLETETPHTRRQSCLQRFLAVSRQICEGNALRQELAGQPIVQLDDYLRFIEADATLWWGSATIGGLLGDGEDELLTHLASFGRNLGAAIRLAVDANSLAHSSSTNDYRGNIDIPWSIRGGTHRSDTGDSRCDAHDTAGTCEGGDIRGGEALLAGTPVFKSTAHIPVRRVDANNLRHCVDRRLDDARAHVEHIGNSRPQLMLTEIVDRARSTLS
ncbi:polyprenyl synthetase family protein [Natrinema soli]|uniref:Polyprenyl synthetase family protein n=1 Tax=Natrinema soli TaxID=1930624 RepID=A0ABD5SSS3_9EURY|nr:class 1 isoprenoid biosynthesis enzyme [Natrinema soli]